MMLVSLKLAFHVGFVICVTTLVSLKHRHTWWRKVRVQRLALWLAAALLAKAAVQVLILHHELLTQSQPQNVAEVVLNSLLTLFLLKCTDLKLFHRHAMLLFLYFGLMSSAALFWLVFNVLLSHDSMQLSQQDGVKICLSLAVLALDTALLILVLLYSINPIHPTPTVPPDVGRLYYDSEGRLVFLDTCYAIHTLGVSENRVFAFSEMSFLIFPNDPSS